MVVLLTSREYHNIDGHEKKFFWKNTSLHPGLPIYEKRSVELIRVLESLVTNTRRDSRSYAPVVTDIKLASNFSSSTSMKAYSTNNGVSSTLQVEAL